MRQPGSTQDTVQPPSPQPAGPAPAGDCGPECIPCGMEALRAQEGDEERKATVDQPGSSESTVQPRPPQPADADAALAVIEMAWAHAGYHGFGEDDGTWSAVGADGTVFTGGTPDELNQAIRADWERCAGHG